MADRDKDQAAPADQAASAKPQQTIVVQNDAQVASRALAEAAAEAEERQADEAKEHDLTVDKKTPADANGQQMYGRYLVDGVLVDPMGRPFDQQPKRDR